MNRKEQIELYKQSMGEEATLRQLVEGQNRLNCCFALVVEGHHPDCRKHPKKRAAQRYRHYYGDGVQAMEGE